MMIGLEHATKRAEAIRAAAASLNEAIDQAEADGILVDAEIERYATAGKWRPRVRVVIWSASLLL